MSEQDKGKEDWSKEDLEMLRDAQDVLDKTTRITNNNDLSFEELLDLTFAAIVEAECLTSNIVNSLCVKYGEASIYEPTTRTTPALLIGQKIEWIPNGDTLVVHKGVVTCKEVGNKSQQTIITVSVIEPVHEIGSEIKYISQELNMYMKRLSVKMSELVDSHFIDFEDVDGVVGSETLSEQERVVLANDIIKLRKEYYLENFASNLE